MTSYRYLTPEWLEESTKVYHSAPIFEEKLKKLSTRLCYRVKSEPDWGIDRDIIFGTFFDQGKLIKMDYFSEEGAWSAEYIVSAPPQEWKRILRKESKFLTDYMLKKIVLEQGSHKGILSVAPHASNIVEFLTQVDLQFPDEMSKKELADYRSYIEKFRAERGV
ncbi:MAG: hypothetical protein RI591_00510 [Dehalococcoidia bacterium]|nr:hypothetical protein [Dehalococcoidia bacterium]